MGILDKITRKKEIDGLNDLVESQKTLIKEYGQALSITENRYRSIESKLSSIKESDTWQGNILGGDEIVEGREITDQDLLKLRQNCISCYYKTPEGKAIIKNLTNYIVGNGIDYTAQDENPIVQEFLDNFVNAGGVRFDRRQINIVKRTLRDGELFIHLISDSKGNTYATRFYPASQISDIKLDPNDAETPLQYARSYVDKNGKAQEEEINASEIHHIKLEVDEDVPRGRPLLENVLRRITQYENWLQGRIITNEAKSSTFLEKIVDGSPSRVASVAASMPSTSVGSFTDDEYAVQKPKPGTVVVHSKSIEYKWVAPNINADDCKADGRQIRLSIAAGVQMPEYLLTSDASNQNYASSLVAESPFVRSIESWRHFFEQELKIIFAKVIQRGIDRGALPTNSTETVMKESGWKKINILKAMKEAAVNPDQVSQIDTQIAGTVQDQTQYEERVIPTKTEVDFEWPSIVTRNLWEETQSYEVHFTNGWASKNTVQMRLGYDPDEEARKITKEKEEEPEEDAYRKMQDETNKLETDLDAQRKKDQEGKASE